MQAKRYIFIISVIVLLLAIPFVAMQFTDEVKWTLFDFVVAGTLLLLAGFWCEVAIRRAEKVSLKIALCLVILALLALVWIELAVGILGTPLGGL